MPVPKTTGDQRLSEWIEGHQVWLWRYLRFLGAASDVAEDLCQETLVAALHHDIAERAAPVAMAWLRTTACNFYRRQLRGRRQRTALQDMLMRDAQVGAHDLLHEAQGDEDRTALRACLGTLSEPARQVLELRYRDNASRSEMAAATSRSEEAIKTMLRRAKDHLRECIERRRTR